MALDKYPQALRYSMLESAPNVYTEKEIPTNIPEGYAMELISNDVEPPHPETKDDAVTVAQFHVSGLSDSAIRKPGRTETVDYSEIRITNVGARTAETLPSGMYQEYYQHDLHSQLFARKNMYIAVKGDGNTNAVGVSGALWYRLVKVSSAELLGLLQ